MTRPVDFSRISTRLGRWVQLERAREHAHDVAVHAEHLRILPTDVFRIGRDTEDAIRLLVHHGHGAMNRDQQTRHCAVLSISQEEPVRDWSRNRLPEHNEDGISAGLPESHDNRMMRVCDAM